MSWLQSFHFAPLNTSSREPKVAGHGALFVRFLNESKRNALRTINRISCIPYFYFFFIIVTLSYDVKEAKEKDNVTTLHTIECHNKYRTTNTLGT